MRRAILLVMSWTGAARADDPPATEPPSAPAAVLTLRTHDGDHEPLLHLDSMLTTPVAQTLLATVERRDAELDLGGTTRALLTAEHWNDPTTNARGVTAGLQLSHDFGFARLIVNGSASQVQARFGSGTAVNAGAALMRTWHLSRWTTAWLSLGLNYQAWLGQPGGAGGVMIWFGFTFR